jgi:hypothetical protein
MLLRWEGLTGKRGRMYNLGQIGEKSGLWEKHSPHKNSKRGLISLCPSNIIILRY